MNDSHPKHVIIITEINLCFRHALGRFHEPRFSRTRGCLYGYMYILKFVKFESMELI